MSIKMSTKRTGIGRKLKAAMQNIHVDVFGYEAKVTTNILAYFQSTSKALQIPRERLVIRIFCDPEPLRIAIYKNGRIIRQIPVHELVTVFTSMPCDPCGELASKTGRNIQSFMQNYAEKHEIPSAHVQVCILTGPEQVWVLGYDVATPKGDIPLKELIKHFMA